MLNKLPILQELYAKLQEFIKRLPFFVISIKNIFKNIFTCHTDLPFWKIILKDVTFTFKFEAYFPNNVLFLKRNYLKEQTFS